MADIMGMHVDLHMASCQWKLGSHKTTQSKHNAMGLAEISCVLMFERVERGTWLMLEMGQIIKGGEKVSKRGTDEYQRGEVRGKALSMMSTNA